MKVLLVSHGDFAKGMCSALTQFFGAKNIYTACVSLENGTAGLHQTVQSYFEQWGDEQVVICSDLMGGSANQSVYQYLSRPNTFLVSGMNLSLVLQLMFKSEITVEELKEMIDLAKNDLVLMNEWSVSMSEDDE